MSPQPIEKGVGIPSEEVWDPWQGHPPTDKRLTNVFDPWKNNSEARKVIDKLLGLGREINDESLGKDQPSREDFETLVDTLINTPEGAFLLEHHVTLGGNYMAVIRSAIDGVVGGKRLEYRAGGRGVSDRGGRKG